MNQYTLIKRFKEGDDSAFSQLLTYFDPMIHSIISGFHSPSGDFTFDTDELYQEACLALAEACRNYDPKMNCKFSTFAYIVIKRRTINVYRNICKVLNCEKYSLDEREITKGDNMLYDRTLHYVRSKRLGEQLKTFIASLNDEEKSITLLKMEDKTYREIADTVGISVKTVDNRLMRIRTKLKKYLNEEGEIKA